MSVGSLKAWGNNGYDLLGSGFNADSAMPAAVSNLASVASQGVGDAHALAVTCRR